MSKRLGRIIGCKYVVHRLAIAIRSLTDRARCVTIVSQLNTGVGVMCGWCLACCIGVVLNTVRESATPDCKENKRADAGSRRFSKVFFVRRVVV